MYGAETWVLKAKHVRRLNSFHKRCIRTILGVTRHQQWKERITSKHLASTFHMQQSVSDFVIEHRLRWLGHLGGMNNKRLPKKVLYGEQNKTRRYWTKRRWRDVAIDGWHELCQDRKEWSELCYEGIESRPRQKNACSVNNQRQSN